MPLMYEMWRVWDLAASEGSGDFTVGTLMGRGFDGQIYVIDVKRERLSPDNVLDSGEGHRRIRMATTVVDPDRGGTGRFTARPVTAFYKKAFRRYGSTVSGRKAPKRPCHAVLDAPAGRRDADPLDDEADWDVKGFVDERRQMMGDGRKPRYDDRIDTVVLRTSTC